MPANPPLNALRAFETAARTGSFANAAREMGVSSAAVSQQIKLLEDYWDTTLFIRQGNRIALTEAGQSAYPQLGVSMAQLNELSDKMRRKTQKKRLVVSAPQSIAETWLAPALAALAQADKSPAIEIRVEDDPVDFIGDKIDLRVFYGHDLYRDHQIMTLFSDQLIAVASLSFLAAQGSNLAQIENRHLIHTDWGRDFATSPSWSKAFADQRLVDHNAGLHVQASSTALNFAESGFGVALIPERMARQRLELKQVVQLDLPSVPMKYAYQAAYPKRLETSAPLQLVLQGLNPMA